MSQGFIIFAMFNAKGHIQYIRKVCIFLYPF